MPIALTIKPGAAPPSMPGLPGAGADDKGSALMDALDQMRALCDQIEAEQMQGRKKDSETPAETAAPGEEVE